MLNSKKKIKAIDGNQIKEIVYDPSTKYMIVYGLIMFINWLLFVLAFNQMYTSYALSIWFFTKNKRTVEIPLFYSLRMLLRYHFGTIVFVSMLSTLLALPQYMFMVIEQALRSLPQHLNVVRYLQALCMCCIHFNESFLRYLS